MQARRGGASLPHNETVDSAPVDFAEVFRAELADIAARRAANRSAGGQEQLRESAAGETSGAASDQHEKPTRDPAEETLGPLSGDGKFDFEHPVLNAVGLSLSGGGIRSASFCLGVLQALDKAGVLKRVDYLSTVSGGGYIGSSLSAAMSVGRGRFPFASKLEEETPAVKHIRNYSNYLVPHGKTDVLESLVIYLRGIVANIILVLPWLIFAAYVTVRSNPTREHLRVPDFFRIEVYNVFPFQHFVITAYMALFLLVVFAVWTLLRSGRRQLDRPEVPSLLTTLYGYALVLTGIVAFFELQPFVLDKVWGDPDLTQKLKTWVQGVSVALAPLAGAAAFFGRQLQALIKRASDTPGNSSKLAAYFGKAMLYLAAAALPLFLWAVYFQLSWWGIADCYPSHCRFPEDWKETPGWVTTAAGALFGPGGVRFLAGRPYPIASFYLLSFFVLVFISMWLRPNANSLHRLYRDRLSKAFLFNPHAAESDELGRSLWDQLWHRLCRGWRRLSVKLLFEPQTNPSARRDLQPLDGFKLTQLDPSFAPYHLLNTALNIQGSRYVNRRGRNADFFMFSRNYVGSEATRYVRTAAMERVVRELDVGTALAVSAAAASSNMGAQSIRPLTPTLALLNVRVGFWLRNPLFIAATKRKAAVRELFSLYFLYELIANLRESSWNVYVTDGGHLENLGAYELLKRRCRLVIVVDAEADSKMTFESLVALQRFARIDLGVLIALPWQKIRDTTLKASDEFAKDGKAQPRDGPHCAIGEIQYPDGGRGVMIYIKASVTGDENDYILNYKERYPLFPHESTGDQFFSEEQFEVYRALGFHAAYGLFDRRDGFAHLDPSEHPCAENDLRLLDQLFPAISKPDPSWPRRYRTFGEWLRAGAQPEPPDPSPATQRPNAET